MDTKATLDDLALTAPPAACVDADFEELSPSEILVDLEAPAVTETRRRKLVCMAEEVRFDAVQAGTLRLLLRRYIDANHHPRDWDEEVAVAAAIRKYIATLPVADLSECQDWLRVERKMPAALEMEVVKMIARKLAATIPDETRSLDVVGDHLIDLVRAYLNRRVLSKRFFGATVLEASLALALMGSPHLAEAGARLRETRVEFIRVVVARQAKLLCSEIEQRFPGKRSELARKALVCLAAAAESAQC